MLTALKTSAVHGMGATEACDPANKGDMPDWCAFLSQNVGHGYALPANVS